MNKKILIPTLALAGLVLVGITKAETVRANNDGNYPPIIQRLVDNFNLDENDVKAVFDEAREEHKALKQQNLETRLSQAVQDGAITEAQKQALLDKLVEKRAEKKQHREEMQAWFEEQGIDLETLREYGGLHHKGFRHWPKPSN